MSNLLGPDGRPLDQEAIVDIVGPDYSPISSEQSAEEDIKTPMEPGLVLAELINKGKVANLSASERKLLKMSLIANEMSVQNLTLWVALHGLATAADIHIFTVTIDKLNKWAKIHPSKWPINAARLQSGSVSFEIAAEPPEQIEDLRSSNEENL